MCEVCDRLDVLVEQINNGERSFDREVVSTLVAQLRVVLGEIDADVASDKPLLEFLEDVAASFQGLSLSAITMSQAVSRVCLAERGRITGSN